MTGQVFSNKKILWLRDILLAQHPCIEHIGMFLTTNVISVFTGIWNFVLFFSSKFNNEMMWDLLLVLSSGDTDKIEYWLI